jgi:hypothetical protein
MRSLLAVALVAAACGGRQPGAAPPPADAEPELALDEPTARATADGFLEVLATMAAIVEARTRDAPADCPGMAHELDLLFTQAEPLFEIARAAMEDPAAAQLLGGELDRHGHAVDALVDRIMAGLVVCKDHPGLAEVMQRMPTL